MSQEQFVILMPYISADLIALIVKTEGVTEEDAMKRLYSSRLYAMLEDEETKLWQYSASMLYSLLKEEEQTGKICFPDV